MTDLDVVVSSPSGNITVLVLTPVARHLQVETALRLLAAVPAAEQVGFVEVPQQPGARAHLEMMGSELCGNGLCALAWHLHEQSGGALTAFSLDSSGIDGALPVEIAGRRVRVHLPVCSDRVSIARHGDHILVQLEGILHVIVQAEPPDRPRAAAAAILDAHALTDRPAVGVVFCSPDADAVSMVPVVHIRSTSTLIVQSGCGSGSLAVTLAEAWQRPPGRTRLDLHQPGGAVISAAIGFDGEVFSAAWIEGEVETLQRRTIEVAAAQAGAS